MSDDYLNPHDHDIPGSSGPDPGLGVHLEPPGPGNVLLTPGRGLPPLLRQLLRHGPDVVSLEPAAAADIPDSEIVGFSRILVHVKSKVHEISIK